MSEEILNTKNEETKSEEMFTKPEQEKNIEFIEQEVDEFDFEGFEVVRHKFFSKANCQR